MVAKKMKTKRGAKRRSGWKRKGTRIPKAGNKGYFKVMRRLPKIVAYSSITSNGVVDLLDPTGTCISFGTPVASVGITNVYDVPFTMRFRLDQVGQYGDIIGIADQYRLSGLKINFNFSQTDSAPGQSLPKCYYMYDYDDASIATPDQLRAKMGLRNKKFRGGDINFTLKPKPAQLIYTNAGALTNGYSEPTKNPWIDCTYSNVEYYAIKGYFADWTLNTSTRSAIRIDVNVLVEAKGLM